MIEYRPSAVRDMIAVRLANLALKLASAHYRTMLRGAILYGMAAVRRDIAEDRDAPGEEWLG